jgi:hypothetical protein
MQKTQILQKMQTQKQKQSQSDFQNLKRPVIILIRDKRNRGVYNETTIFVEHDDPRSDAEIRKLFTNLRYMGKLNLKTKEDSFKLANKKESWDPSLPAVPQPLHPKTK